MKHYIDIERMKPKYVDGFDKGDLVYIQEKIDGANFSIKYDADTDSIKAFSRKTELDSTNTLRGSYGYAQTLDKDILKEVLGDNLIMFAEWLVQHTVVYPDYAYQKAYFYDIFNTETDMYLPQDEAIAIFDKLELTKVPLFYVGEFVSWEHVNGFIGQTQMGGRYGEGVVIKNMTKLKFGVKDSRLPFYVKSVCEEFAETKAHREAKPIDVDACRERDEMKALTSTIVTEARVRKLLNKFVDEGILSEDWDEKDMGIVAKNLGRRLYEDCVKEENDVVEQIGKDFGKFANAVGMVIAKEILKGR